MYIILYKAIQKIRGRNKRILFIEVDLTSTARLLTMQANVLKVSRRLF